MILSRKVVIWSGIIIMTLFALINRIQSYMNAEFVYADASKIFSADDEHLYSLSFEYHGKPYIIYRQFSAAVDISKKTELLIENEMPKNAIPFDFFRYIVFAIILAIAFSGIWIIFLQSFFPKQKKFYFFKKKVTNE